MRAVPRGQASGDGFIVGDGERFRRGAPLNEPDYTTLYSGEEKGYTDYPFLHG